MKNDQEKETNNRTRVLKYLKRGKADSRENICGYLPKKRRYRPEFPAK